MDVVSIIAAVVTLVVTSIGLGLQIASYINSTKNDRPSFSQRLTIVFVNSEDNRH